VAEELEPDVWSRRSATCEVRNLASDEELNSWYGWGSSIASSEDRNLTEGIGQLGDAVWRSSFVSSEDRNAALARGRHQT
jgi:hypothetical protein